MRSLLVRAFALFAILLGLSLLCFRFLPAPVTGYAYQEMRDLGAIKRDWVAIDELPRHVLASIIASEDSGFCAHNGVEWQIMHDLLIEGGARGGSTISQQMVKNLYLWHGESRASRYMRKSLEVPLTLLVELVYPKRRVAALYVNIVEFDTGVFGIEAAAQHHFRVSAEELSRKQAALLAAVLPNPKGYSAVPPDAITARRAAIIEKRTIELMSQGLDSCVLPRR